MPSPQTTFPQSVWTKHGDAFLATALFLATLLLFARSTLNGFVGVDDSVYVTNNAHVQAGLTWRTIVWSFCNVDAKIWHPLTWLSIALDCQLFGLRPAGHHLTSAVIHAGSAAIFYLVLVQMTGARWPAAFCAAAFAWHPLRVESVVWAAERKDVLATFFLLLTVLAYLRYARKRTVGGYLLWTVCYLLGLCAKPMLVTLPALLLLLDFWPLRRFETITSKDLRRALLEKVPILLIASLASAAVIYTEKQGNALADMEGAFSMGHRIANAMLSIILYLIKTLRPIKLSYYYLPARQTPLWQTLLSAVTLCIFTAYCIAQRRTHPWFLVGWLWFIIALLPVLGLIQVGTQSMADRFSYIPSIGVFIALCGAMAHWQALFIHRSRFVIAGTMILLILSGLTFQQIGVWHDSMTLCTHAVELSPANWFAQGGLGEALAKQGNYPDAAEHLSIDEELNPGQFAVENELGNVLMHLDDDATAAQMFALSVKHEPAFVIPHYNWANILLRQGNLDEAIRHYQIYLKSYPLQASAHNNLGIALARVGRVPEAIAEFSQALRLDPTLRAAQVNIDKLRGRSS